VFLHGALLTFVSKEERVMDNFGGQMSLCDFGKTIDDCEGEACMGPGGTELTDASRLYSWNMWTNRRFLRDSMKAVFPDQAKKIDELVDPGEYGLESYVCRLLCVAVFVISITPEIRLCFRVGELLFKLPSSNDSWILLTNAEDVEPTKFLSTVKVKVAGMSVLWKVINFFIVFLPKVILVSMTATSGVTFLMDTAGIDDIIVNSVALGFLLNLDELITDCLLSEQANQLLDICVDYEIENEKDEELRGSTEVWDQAKTLERFGDQQALSYSMRKNLVEIFWIHVNKFYLAAFFVIALVCHYYEGHCVFESGRWISKTMYSPKNLDYNTINAFFGNFKPPIEYDKPYWTMPTAHHDD